MWLALLLLAMGLWRGWVWTTSPQRVALLAQRALEEALGGRAVVGQARFSLTGPIVLEQVSLHVPGLEGVADRLFEAPRVLVEHRPCSLLRGRVSPRRLSIQQPTLYITEHLQRGRFTFEDLLHQPKPVEGRTPLALPEISLTAGRFVLGQVDGGAYQPGSTVSFIGDMSGRAGEPGAYSFALIESAADHAPLRILGRFNLVTQSFEARLESFAFASLPTDALPSRVRHWWQQLDPTGAAPLVKLGFDKQQGLWAQFELQNVALTVPQGQPRPRLSVDYASLLLRGGALFIDALEGTTHEVQYSISGRIDGLDPDAGAALRVRASGRIPDQENLVQLLPPLTRQYLKRFDARGRFALDMTSLRLAGQEHVVSTGRLDLIETTVSDQRNPYPLEQLAGTIEFGSQRIELNLAARGRSGARVNVTGGIAPPDERGEMDIRVHMTDVPIDDLLLDSLDDEERSVVQEFLSRADYQRLRDAGLLRADPADAGDGPVFVPGGWISLVIRNHRPAGADQSPRITNTIDLAGVQALYAHWPYPLRIASGSLVVQGRTVELRDIRLVGPRGGTGLLRGRITPHPDRPRQPAPDVHISAQGLPIDSLLLASLPPQEAQWLESLHVQGAFDADAHIFAPAAGAANASTPPSVEHAQANSPEAPPVDFSIRARLAGAEARPFAGRAELHDVGAELVIGHRRVDVPRFTARLGEGQIDLQGQVRWRDAGLDVDLVAGLRNVQPEEGLLDLAPPDLADLTDLRAKIDALRPAGLLDADLRVRRHVGRETDYAIDLRPRRLAVTWRDQRVAFDDITGSAHVRPGGLELQQMQAALGGARVALDGRFAWSPQPTGELHLSAGADAIEPAFLAILPQGLADALASIQLAAGFKLRDAVLKIDAAHAGPDVAFSGHLTLAGASADLGVPISELDGRLVIDARQGPADIQPRLDLDLDARQLRIAGRRVSPLRVHLTPVGNGPHLELSTFQGDCYGGKIVGTGQLRLPHNPGPSPAPGPPSDPLTADAPSEPSSAAPNPQTAPGWYRLQISLHNAALHPMIHPDQDQPWRKDASPPATPSVESVAKPASPAADSAEAAASQPPSSALQGDRPTGVLSANFAIEAVAGDPDSRRGRGELQIQGARLYELPLAMSLLQIINLSWPSSRAFDRVAAQYLIDGHLVRIETMRFDAPGVQIVGQGALRWPDLTLDLQMFSRNPNALGLGPLTDALDMIKDELISIRVTGTLADPQARLQSLPGVRRSWREIFGPAGR